LVACRVCLVEIEAGEALAASCSTPVTNGMKVFTKTKELGLQEKHVVETFAL
jgi:NADH-quinone oxidoreductase subunit G